VVETLTVAGVIAVALFALLMLSRPRKVMAGEMTEPMNLERNRAKSEANMAAAETQVLTEADAGEAAVLVGHFRDLPTDEQPLVTPVRRHTGHRRPVRWQRVAARRRVVRGFATDPLGAAIPGRHRRAEPVEHMSMALAWFTTPAIEASRFPELPAEPEPLPPLDFTGEFHRSDLFALLAAADEVGAQR